jgi:hypothetical protein
MLGHMGLGECLQTIRIAIVACDEDNRSERVVRVGGRGEEGHGGNG